MFDLLSWDNWRRPLECPRTMWIWRLFNRTWNPITSPRMKQLTWLRIIHSGDWCLCLVMHVRNDNVDGITDEMSYSSSIGAPMHHCTLNYMCRNTKTVSIRYLQNSIEEAGIAKVSKALHTATRNWTLSHIQFRSKVMINNCYCCLTVGSRINCLCNLLNGLFELLKFSPTVTTIC